MSFKVSGHAGSKGFYVEIETLSLEKSDDGGPLNHIREELVDEVIMLPKDREE